MKNILHICAKKNTLFYVLILTVICLLLCSCSSKEARFNQVETELNATIEQCVTACKKIEPPRGLASLEDVKKKKGLYAYQKEYGELYFKRREALAPVETKLEELQNIADGNSELMTKFYKIRANWREIRTYQLIIYAQRGNLLINGRLPNP